MRTTRHGRIPSADAEIPLVGQQEPRTRICRALIEGESLLVLGPPGAGKTKLLRSAREARKLPAIHLQTPPVFHELLVALASALLDLPHKPFQRFCGEAGNRRHWLARQTSIGLKGMLWESLEAEPVPLILDDVRKAGHSAGRFFHRLYFAEGMTIIAAAHDFASLGGLGRLFWDPRHILALPALQKAEAVRLFDLAAERFRLREFDLDEFQPQVIDSAAGNPGQLIEMCRRASLPQYRSGRHIKFALVRIDTVAQFLA